MAHIGDLNASYVLVPAQDLIDFADAIRAINHTDQPLEWPYDFVDGITSSLIPEYVHGELLRALTRRTYGAGAKKAIVYENPTDVTDSRGIAPHTILPIVKGGTDNAIFQTVLNYTYPGIGTQGDKERTYNVNDTANDHKTVRFSRPANENQWIFMEVTVAMYANFDDTRREEITSRINQIAANVVDQVEFGGELDKTDIQNALRLYNEGEPTFYIDIDGLKIKQPGSDAYITGNLIEFAWNECPYTYADIGRPFVDVTFTS